MTMVFRIWMSLLAGVCVATWAHATPKDYCEAYARDFADKVAKENAAWAVRHGNALEACLLQFQPKIVETPNPVERKKPTLATKTPVTVAKSKLSPKPRPKPRPAPKPVVEDVAVDETEPLPEPAVIVAPDIAPPARKSAVAGKPEDGNKAKTLFAKLFPRKAKPEGSSKPVEKGKLVSGSAAWLDYCENKYASFSRETGTYRSYKGVERKCFVTD